MNIYTNNTTPRFCESRKASLYTYQIDGQKFSSKKQMTEYNKKHGTNYKQEDAEKKINNYVSKKPQLYEIGDAGKHYVRLHFDIDGKKKLKKNPSEQDYIRIMKGMKKAIKKEFDEDVIFLIDMYPEEEKRLSMHVIVPSVRCINTDIKKFIQNVDISEITTLEGVEIDTTIYGGGEKKFRIIGEKKTDDDYNGSGFQPYKIVGGKLKRYKLQDPSVTYLFKTDECTETMKYEEEETKQTKKEKIHKEHKEIILKKENTRYVSFYTDTEIKELLYAIDNARVSRNDWLSILIGLSGHFEDGRTVAEDWSKTSDKYDPVTFADAWDWCLHNGDKATIHSVFRVCEDTNESKYNEITKKAIERNKIFFNMTHYDVAKKFIETYKNDFIHTNGEVFWWTGFFWKKETSRRKFHEKIGGEFYNFLDIILNKHFKDDDAFKKMKVNLMKLKNENYRENLVKDILRFSENEEIKLNNKSFLFAFNNKIINLQTMEEQRPKKDDYITITTGYDYREPTEGEEELVRKLLREIFPVQKERSYALKIMSESLEGVNSERFVIAEGSGGNGKGLLGELIQKSLGDYAVTGNNAILQNGVKMGACPEIASLDFKRLVVFREPTSKKAFNTATIKELTGGSEINARMCYSNKTKVVLHSLVMTECNEKPKMDELQGMDRRLIILMYRSEFVKKEDYDNKKHLPYVFVKNPYYKTVEFQEQHRHALFKILFEYYRRHKEEDLIEPNDLYMRRCSYSMESDTVGSWLTDHYDITDDEKDVVTLKKIFTEFKESAYFFNLSRTDKRKYNSLKAFERIIIQHNILSKQFVGETRKKNHLATLIKNGEIDKKATRATNILIKLKRKEGADAADEDEEYEF